MCIAVPSRLVSLVPGPMPMGQVEHGGVLVPCCLAYVPEAVVGDYVIVQNGFALDVLDEESAAASLAAFAELGVTPAAPPSQVGGVQEGREGGGLGR